MLPFLTTPPTAGPMRIPYACEVIGSGWVERLDGGDRQLRTVSMWVKLASTTDGPQVYSIDNVGGDETKIRVYGGKMETYDSVAVAGVGPTESVDLNWHHTHLIMDSNNADPDRRYEYWIDGLYIGSGVVTQGANFATAATAATYLGFGVARDSNGGGQRLLRNGFTMAEVHVMDGLRVEAAEMGLFMAGDWYPRRYQGEHGEYGLYLDFSNAGDLGEDSSGVGNDCTANAVTQVLDTPFN